MVTTEAPYSRCPLGCIVSSAMVSESADAVVCVAAQLHAGESLFSQGNFGAALEVFRGAHATSGSADTQRWLRKCQAELALAVGSPPLAAGPRCAHAPRRGWSQTDSHVTLTLRLSCAVDPSAVKVSVSSRSLRISLPEGASSAPLSVSLAAAVAPGEHRLSASGDTLSVRLRKAACDGVPWPSFETSVLDAAPPAAAPPTQRKASKDWAALARALDEEEAAEAPLGGDAALNRLFQSIYSKADDDTRRAMQKSYVESGGTCLSTDWREVGKQTVQVTPPEGMEARPYGT